MVFESLYTPAILRDRKIYAFLMGAGFSLLGMEAAILFFPEDPSPVAVAFISLLLLPTVNALLAMQERTDQRHAHFSLRLLISDHRDLIEIFFFIFLGITVAFGLLSSALPTVQRSAIFADQLRLLSSTETNYPVRFGEFGELLRNNLGVLFVCLFASFLYGSGAIFIITWNATVVGAIFGHIAQASAHAAFTSPVLYFLLMLLAVLPHLMAEAFGYFLGGIAGGIVSVGILHKKVRTPAFNYVMRDAMVLVVLAVGFLVLGAAIEAHVSPSLFRVLVPHP